MDLTACSADVFLSIAEHTIAQIKSDAQTLAALTANVDVLSRQKRLQGYIDAGKSLLFFAASFIPIVGEVLLVVSAAQLIDTIYEGFSAWSRGDSDEALNDLLDVADNLALAAATAGAIKTAGFTAGLIKVRVRTRLAPVALGPHAVPSSRRAAGTSGCRQPRLVSARTTAVPEAG